MEPQLLRYRINAFSTDVTEDLGEVTYTLLAPPPLPNIGDAIIADKGKRWTVVRREFAYNPDEVVIVLYCEPLGSTEG